MQLGKHSINLLIFNSIIFNISILNKIVMDDNTEDYDVTTAGGTQANPGLVNRTESG